MAVSSHVDIECSGPAPRAYCEGRGVCNPRHLARRFIITGLRATLPFAMLDTDIDGLDPAQASEYVLAFITTLKRTEKALADAAEDAAVWTRRVTL
ncbi:MAG TPA: hypothetical protein VL359_13165, partial [bacterium]|nr:hypothetical protein [bacterium]